MVRRTFRNSSLIICGCIKAFLLLLRREGGTVGPPCSTHGTTCLYRASISGQTASTNICLQIWLTITLHSSRTWLISCLLVRFECLVFLWRVSLIYQGSFLILLILLQSLGSYFWKMLLLNFMFLLMLSHDHLIQIFWASYWHCFYGFPGSVSTLTVERRLIKHHLAIAILMWHVWRKTNEMPRICWSMHVFMYAHWIISWVIFLPKLLSNSTILESTCWNTPFSCIVEWILLFQLLSVNLGVTRCSLIIVFCLDDPIVWRWSGKRPKTLVIRCTLEVLICELNSSTIWIFSAPNLWVSLCNLLTILVAHTIVHNGFVLLVDSAIGLWRVALTRFTYTIIPYLRITVISSNQITCTRGCISACLGTRNGHHILLTLGLVMRLLHFLLHESIRQPEQRFFSWNMVLTLHALEASRLAHLFHVHRASYLPHVAINYCIVCHGYVAYEEVWF